MAIISIHYLEKATQDVKLAINRRYEDRQVSF